MPFQAPETLQNSFSPRWRKRHNLTGRAESTREFTPGVAVGKQLPDINSHETIPEQVGKVQH